MKTLKMSKAERADLAAFLADQYPDLQGKAYEYFEPKMRREFRNWLSARLAGQLHRLRRKIRLRLRPIPRIETPNLVTPKKGFKKESIL